MLYNCVMTEENLPELRPPRKRERRKPSKEEVISLAKAFMEINPLMDPQEVIRRTREYHQAAIKSLPDAESRKKMIEQALREEKLRLAGLKPEEWTFYGVASDPKTGADTKFAREDMEEAAKKFPTGIELFITQGRISATSDVHVRKGAEPYHETPHLWETYIRVKPETQLSASQAQIEGPAENPQ